MTDTRVVVHTWWGPPLRDAGEGLVAVVTSALGLGIALFVLDGAGARSWLDVLAVAVLMAAGDRLVRPVVRLVAVGLGVLGALFAGIGAQVLIAWGALTVVPGITVRRWEQVFVLLLVAAAVMAGGRWLVGANDSSYVLGDVLRRARSRARRGAGPGRGEPGLLVVMLDGVSRTVFAHAVDAGLVPTMARWLRTGSHRLDGWWARVPATTPASQAGLLHGSSEQVPAFRWWDKELGRLVVTNRAADAALVEERMSDGDGLLAHGGVAISTMFSGDAATALLVLSRARGRRRLGPGTGFIRFFASPYVLTRTLGLTLGEMLKELYQGRRQRTRGVSPRVPRRGPYVVLRALSNVLLRDLTTALVAEQLLDGAPTVFVDLVDYDEIAHHAGPVRPEALRALEGLDRVLEILAEVAAHSPRSYRMVVLSDHGQSLGATFEQVEGISLHDVVRDLMAVQEEAADHPAAIHASAGEEWGPLNALVGSSRSDWVERVEEKLEHRGEHRGEPGYDHLGADQSAVRIDDAITPAARDPHLPEVAVTASGNLGAVWFPNVPGELTLERISALWPRLVPGLLARGAVGLVVARTIDRGPVALGAHGTRLLSERDPSSDDVAEAGRARAVQGEDPLGPYGPRARTDLLRAVGLAHAGDLLVVSTVDAQGSVHAFEELVGSHGGLGGAQNDALLLYPAEWAIDADLCSDPDGADGSVVGPGEARMLGGSEAVHLQLARWQHALGLRP